MNTNWGFWGFFCLFLGFAFVFCFALFFLFVFFYSVSCHPSWPRTGYVSEDEFDSWSSRLLLPVLVYERAPTQLTEKAFLRGLLRALNLPFRCPHVSACLQP